MEQKQIPGFCEIPHTADISLMAWAVDLADLLQTAAFGMYALMGVVLESKQMVTRKMQVDGIDAETLLVAFLGELLYLAEIERLGFSEMQVTLEEYHLTASLTGAQIASQSKVIKAVTYHDLAVVSYDDYLQTTIVFDV